MRHAQLVLIAMVVGLAIPSARAATLTWGTSGTGGSGTWSAVGIWSGITWNNANNDDAWFTGTSGTVTLTQAQTANSITFDSFSGTYAVGTAGQSLTVNGGGLTMNSGAGAVTISSPVTLGAAQSWTNNSSSLLTAAGNVTNGGNLLTVAGSGSTTFSGAIAGAGGLTKSGASTLTLSASNSYAGDTTISQGTLRLNNASAAGTNTIILGDANTAGIAPQLVVNSGNNTSPINNITVSSQGSGALIDYLPASTNYNGFGSGSSTLTLTGAATFRAANLAGTASGYMFFNSALVGAGQLTLGTTNGKRLILNRDSPSFTGDIVIENGAVLTPFRRLTSATGNSVTVNSGGILDASEVTNNINALNGSGTVQATFNGNGTLVVGKAGGSGTFSGTMRNNGRTLSLTKTGAGVQALSGPNITYDGATTINGGTLQLQNATGFASSGITNTATLQFDLSDGTSQTYANTISGAGGQVLKTGAGTLALSTSNSYTGGTTLAAGTLRLGNAGGLGAVSGGLAVNGGTLDLGGNSVTVGLLTGSSGATITSNTTGAATLTASSASSGTYAGSITNGSGTVALVKAGAGTLTLSASNSFTGGTTLNAGVLSFGPNALGTGAVTLNSGTLQWASGNSQDLSSQVALVSGSTATLDTNGNDVTFASVFGGSTSAALVKAGSGTLTLSVSTSYTGTTRIAAGSLSIGNAAALQNTTLDLNAADAGTVAAIAQNSTLGGLAGSRNLDMLTRTLSIGNNGQSTTYSGTLSNGALVKIGSGTLTLSATNAYAGDTMISQGALRLNNASAAGTGTIILGDANTTGSAPQLVINSGNNTSPTNNITVSSQGSGALIDYLPASTGYNGFGTGTSSSGTSTLTLNGAATFRAANLAGDASGYMFVNMALVGGGQLTLGTTNGKRFILNRASPSFTGDIVIENGAVLTPFARLTSTTGNSVTVNSGGILDASEVTNNINALNGSGTVQATFNGNGSLVVGKAGGSGTFSGMMRNNGRTLSLTKTGAGVQVLSGSGVTYGGATTINGGTLQLQNATGFASSGITNTATLQFDLSADTTQTYANTISGAGGQVLKTGAGVLTLSGSNAYTGSTSVSAGTLRIGDGGTAGSIGSTSGVNVAAGATLAFNRTDTYGGTFNRVVSGSGGIRVLAGRLTLGGSNTYSGPTVVAGGTLAPSAATALGQSALILAGAAPGDGGVLDVTSLGSGLSVANGQTLGGYGTVLGNVTIAGGAIVSPGDSIGALANTGTQTWGPAGRYLFEITNANGDGSFAGSRWDLLTVSSLLITATSSNQFIIDLQSLTNPTDQTPGAMSVGNWDPNSSYQWKFLVADTTTFTAANFDTSWFTVSTSTTTFLNPTNGSFYVARGGGNGGLGGSTAANELYIVYAAVPEPGTLALAGIGLAVLGWSVARRRCRRA